MDEGDNAHEHEHDASCYNGCYCELTMPADNVATMSNVAADCSLTLIFFCLFLSRIEYFLVIECFILVAAVLRAFHRLSKTETTRILRTVASLLVKLPPLMAPD